MQKLIITIAILFVSFFCRADEGMWLPQLLAALNEKDMKAKGMKISTADIYNINKASLKDAIVSFGGFCTAEVISDQGLLLTNHHCGFDAIQNHSSIENNYIQNGFWAYNKGQELTNPGLTATFIVRIEEVTSEIIKGTENILNESQRQSIIDKNSNAFKTIVKKEAWQDILIRPFFDGNKYFMFITETYKDVRLVGAPPSSIGNFGKDTDNWMWPRHTGDFSMFRIYADVNNKPAEYSPTNVPYKPKKSLNISLKGLKENDFTMVFGFPGRTNEYLHSSAVEQIMTVNDPAKIDIRHKALTVIDGFMRKDEKIKIQYAAKYAGIQNAYKKWQGEVLGITKTNAVEKKKMYEAAFQQMVNSNNEWKQKYGTLLSELATTYDEYKKYALARDYFNEVTSKIEAFAINGQLNNLRGIREAAEGKDYSSDLKKTTNRLSGIYNEYSVDVDRKLFEVLIEKFVTGQSAEFVPQYLTDLVTTYNKDYTKLANDLYSTPLLTNATAINSFMEKNSDSAIAINANSKVNKLYIEMNNHYSKSVSKKLNEIQNKINKLNRSYMQAQMDVMKNKAFYPDANSTLRLTYGNVKGYKSRDAVEYHFYTYLDGVMEKYKPGDYEFDVPQKLIDLYNKKDFGPYGVNGKQPVCFIAANHTTGGNSGSPALDAYGNLVGLNFDRVWEGTMSDINYDVTICRNIMVDVRYVLFIVDKFAGAKNIISELKLIK